jgi:hypothetical protein
VTTADLSHEPRSGVPSFAESPRTHWLLEEALSFNRLDPLGRPRDARLPPIMRAHMRR